MKAALRKQCRFLSRWLRRYLDGGTADGFQLSRLRPGSTLGLGLGCFLTSFLPLSLLAMRLVYSGARICGKPPVNRRVEADPATSGSGHECQIHEGGEAACARTASPVCLDGESHREILQLACINEWF